MITSLRERSDDEWFLAIDRHMCRAFSAALCFAPDADWHEDGAYTRCVTGLPNPFGNLIWNAHFGDAAIDGQIKDALEPIVERGAPGLWFIGPNSAPSNLKERVLASGLIESHPLRAMAIELKTVQRESLPGNTTIDEVCDEETMNDWLATLAGGYDLPREVANLFSHWPAHLGLSSRSPMRAFIARQEGRPVACSLLYIDEGVAGIYCVATVPDARNQGLGRAVTLAPLLEARNSGYSVAVLQSSVMGESVYRRIGFQSFGDIATLVHTGQ